MFGNLGDMMGKLKEAQKKAEEAKERLKSIYVNAESSGGKVKVVMSADRQLKEVEISDQVLEDKEELSDHLIIAINKALEKAGEINEREMQSAARGALPNIPGL